MKLVNTLSLLLIFIASFKITTLLSQDQDSIRFASLHAKALEAAAGNDHKSAIIFYKRALPFAHSLREHTILNRELAVAFFKDNNLDSARFWASRNFNVEEARLTTEALQTEVANTYNVMRMIALKEGHYDQAIEAMRKAIDRLERHKIFNEVLCAAYLDLGINYWRLSNFDEALKHTEKSLSSLEKLSPQPEKLRLRCMIMLGLIRWNKRDLAGASAYYRYVLGITGKDVSTHARDHFATCSNLGAIYSDRKLFDSALVYYQQALDVMPVLRKSAEAGHLASNYEAITLNNIGNIYTLQEDFEKAIHFYQRSLTLRKKLYGEDHPEIAQVKATLAESYSGQQQFGLALRYCQESIRIRKKFFGTSNSVLSQSYNAMGRIYHDKEDHRMAITYFDSALRTNPKVAFGKMIVYNAINEAFESLLLKMECLVEYTDKPDLAEIDRLYAEARGQIGYALALTDDEALHSDIYELSDKLFDVYFIAQKFSPEYVNRLWEISEFKKASKFTYHLQRLPDQHIPQLMRDEGKKLKDSISVYLNKKLQKNMDVDSMLFVLNRKHDDFIHKLERDFPHYHALKYPTLKVPLNEVQSQLKEGVAVLSFFQTQKTIYIIYIDRHRVLLSQKQAAQIDSLTEELNRAILLGGKELFKKSQWLKRMVLADAGDLGNITTLKIIPDGTAWKIPFSLLPDEGTDHHAYLGQRINMVYLYSFEHQRLLPARKPDNNNKVLAFSFSTSDINDKNAITSFSLLRDRKNDLPGTSQEIREISKVWDGEYYFSGHANESNFKKMCGNYQIIHLALHGAFDEFDPDHSRLIFTNDEAEDGQLHAYEIYNLSLNAELAVLTACNSGAGKITSGEGLISLGRAFAFAGVNSVLLSRWEVSDATAPIIMKYFYEGLKDNLPKSEALRQAKMKFLLHHADNITSAPYYWDSFYILGDDEPLRHASFLTRPTTYASLSVAVTLMLILFFMIRRRKQIIEKQE
ncbi:MAG: CHAT domain-containing protein [Bacteroidota bacterium]